MEVSNIKLGLLINTVDLLPEFQQCPMLTTTKNVNDWQNKINLQVCELILTPLLIFSLDCFNYK